MSKAYDLNGATFGLLTVLSRAPKNKSGRAMWLCRCDCGTEKTFLEYNLKGGYTKSCGCRRGGAGYGKPSHAGVGTRIYSIWRGIISRCNNKNIHNFNRYGGRGIKIYFTCFEDFRHWALNNGYEDNLSIDRIDNDGPYGRDNCRWATNKEQGMNTSRTRLITHPTTGETLCAQQWSFRLGGQRSLVTNRIIQLGWTPQKAIMVQKSSLSLRWNRK